MKRVISVILVSLMVAALFTGCGKSADIAGKYIVKTVNGETLEESFKKSLEEFGEYTLDDYLELIGLESLDDFMTIDLNADGTAQVSVAMEDEESKGTWKQSGDKVTITIDGEAVDFTIKGNELSAKLDDQDYVFIKK